MLWCHLPDMRIMALLISHQLFIFKHLPNDCQETRRCSVWCITLGCEPSPWSPSLTGFSFNTQCLNFSHFLWKNTPALLIWALTTCSAVAQRPVRVLVRIKLFTINACFAWIYCAPALSHENPFELSLRVHSIKKWHSDWNHTDLSTHVWQHS